MDIGVLASLRAFKTPPMSSPRNDHIRGTAANIPIGRIHFAGKAVVFLAAVF